ncbi:MULTISPECIES: pyrophosphate--fructose-6-phosphate 1-phosphotransferase [unclassified Pseudactinotalea]|uniref:pyrophosphate--fructose-6-phosphate 1-phosphotransferase n=1 Tax=unclassified Pseudactinotalea TaxID=2649176 RepID=UPI00128DFBA4|nr:MULTISPECIES: pyrophosphate--fructose-6-phosphate 1-phosphotransferase [unclassified Pseudactinotalea]MPV49440.1 pyrophosphate--fructose-6-phosphate 1-phosphotransferase [Pseudactinotalea sp. HY160]QGH69271.1 pyrophosphate--fructose-6-phosphate 1-phosphotransferase [Pseudactinotalea sp. HY158]
MSAAIRKVALLTAGGFAPCLSSAVGGLIERYTEKYPDVEIIAYQYGYHGLLTGNSVTITPEARANAARLHDFGGSPIGNSRVKLTNAKNLVERGLVREGQDPLQVAAEQLRADGVDVLHTIGGDDTNITAASLAEYLENNGHHLTVVGLPKTIDNDIVPIRQSLGAQTAAEQASVYAQNIIGEHRSNPRMLIVHEVMGRHCGWLTAAAARDYRDWLETQEWNPDLGLTKDRWDVHAVFLPELAIDMHAEADRLRGIMDEIGNVNIFLSEGAGVPEIIAELEAAGVEVQRDPFGHVKLDTINPGAWFADRFAQLIGAEKTMVQKSGYFSRSAKANATDLALIASMVEVAVEAAVAGTAGVVGHDEERGEELRVIEFPRIAGGKAFDIDEPWFTELLAGIGQAHAPAAAH